jgi:hypothetical protein
MDQQLPVGVAAQRRGYLLLALGARDYRDCHLGLQTLRTRLDGGCMTRFEKFLLILATLLLAGCLVITIAILGVIL